MILCYVYLQLPTSINYNYHYIYIYIIRERHTKSDTYWPHQHDCLLQQLYTFLCVHCEYFYYVYFVYFPHEGSSLPFLNKILLIIYAAQGTIPQKTIVTRPKSVKFHPQEQIKEATTSHKELFKSCLSLCTKQSQGPILVFYNTCCCTEHTFKQLIMVTGV